MIQEPIIDIDVAKEHGLSKEEYERIIEILQEIGAPNGLGELGYTADDVPALVEGTLPQHRVTKLAPRATDSEELYKLFNQSMQLW